MNKLIFGFLFLMLVGFGMSANSEPSVCCEKTTSGAWCVNDVESACNPSYNSAPTSCDSTSYCRTGTCYDSEEGICMGNTPQNVCNENGGTWDTREVFEVPQCQLGCCVIADQAAFVSLVRCKRLSTLFGVENDYRTDIDNEMNCISEAQSQDVGACVYESGYERICEFTTRGECKANEEVVALNQANISLSGEKTFYQDFLCSAEELNTACARQSGTSCFGGDVYWMDSCGNKENVYSSDKDKSWNNGRVIEADEICEGNDGTDMNCGNCDYLLGSRCAEFDGVLGGPADSDHYCQKTECVDRNGEKRINGESWCVSDNNLNSVGSRYFKEICVDGTVRVEPCADFRNEICLESFIETKDGQFGTAGCRVNRWQDCLLQTDMDDCNNIDRRDCKWIPSVTGMVFKQGTSDGESSYSNPTTTGSAFNNPTATGMAIASIVDEPAFTGLNGLCVPSFAPGLKFWEDNSAKQICGQASARCTVVIEEGLLGGSDVIEGAECLEAAWAEAANGICSSLGDCGGAVNYDGVYSDDGYKWTFDGEEKFI
ncbi:MAG: hypothetical protein V1888_02680 [archaeon]